MGMLWSSTAAFPMVSFALFEQCRHAMTTTKQRPASTKKEPSTRAKRTSRKGPPALSAQEVLGALEGEYAPFPWEARYDATSEVVFTILSQHTSDRNSERAFARLMERFETFEELAAGDVQVIEECISIGGLAKIKAPRIKQVLNLIIERCGNLDLSFLREMPLDEAKKWLKELPGVGPKTAGIILCFSLGMPAMAVDTHIERVVKRLGLVGPKTTVEKAQDMLEEMVEDHQVYPLHVALITHGRQVCKAPRPLCPRCVLEERCPSRPGFEKQEALRVKKREAAVAAKKKAEAKAKAAASKKKLQTSKSRSRSVQPAQEETAQAREES